MSNHAATTPSGAPPSSWSGDAATWTSTVVPSLRRASQSPSHDWPVRRRSAKGADASSPSAEKRRAARSRPTASSGLQPNRASAWRFHRVTIPSTSVAATAARTPSTTNVSLISGHAPGGRARSGIRQSSTSNHTRVGGPSRIPHRSASSSTKYRPHPPLPSAFGGPGEAKPLPMSSISTRTRSATTSTRMMAVASDPLGPCLTALVTTSLTSSRKVSRHAGRRRGRSRSISLRARATASGEAGYRRSNTEEPCLGITSHHR